MDINTANPLKVPYQTGSYLIFDNTDGKTNFRTAMSLPERPYRASGSHQLNLDELDTTLRMIVADASPDRLHLVDLRQESHGFVDIEGSWGRAVSWYGDNDWSNVGKSDRWVVEDERFRLRLLAQEQIAHVYTVIDDTADNRKQERQLPVSDEPLVIVGAFNEVRAAKMIGLANCELVYHRLPVTDHCAPLPLTLGALKLLAAKVTSKDWVHFHCHGGDGRTTTFLALWDMLMWEGRLPGVDEFAERQYELFPYQLYPGAPSDDWKYSLAVGRWEALEKFLQERS